MIRLPRKSAFLVASLAALITVGAAADDADKLVGDYSIVSGEKSGLAEPDERVHNSKVQFSKDRVVVTDKDSKEIYGASYKLDTSKTPWRITMVSKLAEAEDVTVKGLIQKDGDTVKLVYALPGGDDPTEFKTREKQMLFVMKKVEK